MTKVSALALTAFLAGAGSAAAAGCGPAYSSGTAYGPGDTVSATTSVTTTKTESCVPGTTGCSATCTPGTSGCPTSGTKTVETTVTTTHNYQCVAGANSAFCPQSGFAPGSVNTGIAWTKGAECSGSIAPTSSPVYTALASAGGCPSAYNSGTAYESGDRVSKDNKVYQCKEGAVGLHCPQAGFEPGTDDAAAHWKMAWTMVGPCSGTIAPTTSPVLDPARSVGGCPAAYVEGGTPSYEQGDTVSVTISTTPPRSVVYECNAAPMDRYCSVFGPTHATGGMLGWTLKGNCAGSIAPTASPVFTALTEVGSGCPKDWSASITTYAKTDQVALVTSTKPPRKIVYECNEPGWCNQGESYKPGSIHGGMAWALKGQCDGTMAPTLSPIVYDDGCSYTKNVVTKNTGTTSCAHGSSTDCRCTTTSTGAVTCTRPTDTITPTATLVGLWSAGVQYEEGDVVRISNRERFKCRGWPYYLWCREEAYQPTEKAGIWSAAWMSDGVCETHEPTSTPSTQPSSSPSISAQPSSIPSTQPSSTPSISTQPSSIPSTQPSSIPSKIPSQQPSTIPSKIPSSIPSKIPSQQPSTIPSKIPSSIPSKIPSQQPSTIPSKIPSSIPSKIPSEQPSSIPSKIPSSIPSTIPSKQPSSIPSKIPSSQPSSIPSKQPSSIPSAIPSSIPSTQPSSKPSTCLADGTICVANGSCCSNDCSVNVCTSPP